MGKKSINNQVWEPIVIVGKDNPSNNEELKKLLQEIGLKLIEPENDPTRGLSLATVSKGSLISIDKAIRLAPILNRKERHQLLKELRQKNEGTRS